MTYRIASFIYIALAGGISSLAVIGFVNCRMLKIGLLRTIALAVTAVLVYALRCWLFSLDARRLHPLPEPLQFSLYKLTDLAVFLVYYHALKVPYRLHMIYHGDYRLLLYQGLGIILCVGGFIVDTIAFAAIFR